MYPFVYIFNRAYSSYNLCIAAGIAISLILFIQTERTIDQKDKDEFLSVFGILLVVGFLGAYIGNKILQSNSIKDFIVSVRSMAGLTFLCGAISSFAVYVVIYALFLKKIVIGYKVLNSVIPYVVLGHAFGRVGCLLAGCCYGKPTSLVIGIHYPHESIPYDKYGDIGLYPTPIIEMLLLLIIFLILKKLRDWEIRFCVYLTLYALGRFGIEFLRGDERGQGLWLFSPSQLICSVMFLSGIIIFRMHRKLKLS
jgi:phosphatidylglycerol:prolipoprotein diacylglycerol transferase